MADGGHDIGVAELASGADEGVRSVWVGGLGGGIISAAGVIGQGRCRRGESCRDGGEVEGEVRAETGFSEAGGCGKEAPTMDKDGFCWVVLVGPRGQLGGGSGG